MIFELKKDGEIYMDGTLTEVLCVLDALDDEPKKEPQIKNRKECILELYNKYDNQSICDFFGNEVSIIGINRDMGVCGFSEITFDFSDGSELKLKC